MRLEKSVVIILSFVARSIGQLMHSSHARTTIEYTAEMEDQSSRSYISAQHLNRIIDLHNEFRLKQRAADMERLKWSDFLATLAQQWTDQCLWRHGQLPQDPYTKLFETVGQSMFASSGEVMNPETAIRVWLEEERNFDSETLSCRERNSCNLYQQVVWSSSRLIGCSLTICQRLNGLNWTNSSLFVCNYGPSGVIPGEKPFQHGVACSKCHSGKHWCENGLCSSKCTVASETCACQKSCICGFMNSEECNCTCWDGYHGPDCSDECIDFDSRCFHDDLWQPSACQKTNEHGSFVRRKCPAMCQVCQAASKSSSDSFACIHENHLRFGALSSSLSSSLTAFLPLVICVSMTVSIIYTARSTPFTFADNGKHRPYATV